MKLLNTGEMITELLKDPDNLEAYQEASPEDTISFKEGIYGKKLCWSENLGCTEFLVRPYDNEVWVVIKKEE